MKLIDKAIILPLAACIFTIALMCISCNKDSTANASTKVKCVTCANGGLCINDTCRCPSGWEGTGCQTPSIDKFIGSWQVFEKGTITPSREYNIEIESGFSPTSVDSAIITNLYNSFFNEVVSYAIADTLYIPSQQISGYIIIGKGYIHSSATFGTDGALTMNYAVTTVSTGAIDDFGYYSSSDSPSLWSK